MVGVLAFAYAVGLVVLGATAATWWWVLAAALVGTALYALMRSQTVLVDIQEGHAVSAVSFYYVSQVATAAILFGIGRLIGMAI